MLHWVSRIHYQVFALHPDLEVIQRPRPDDAQLAQAALSRAIPPQVALGFHLCFGTLGGWPRFDRTDAADMPRVMEEHRRALDLVS